MGDGDPQDGAASSRGSPGRRAAARAKRIRTGALHVGRVALRTYLEDADARMEDHRDSGGGARTRDVGMAQNRYVETSSRRGISGACSGGKLGTQGCLSCGRETVATD